jgi:hypothetical protein
MKYLLIAILLAGAYVQAFVCRHAHAQTSITEMEDDPVVDQPLPNPDPNNNILCCNLGKWAWNAGPLIGCKATGQPYPNDWNCDAGGNASWSTQYTVDGQSLQMNLMDVDGYPGYQYPGCIEPSVGCYSDVLFFNRLSTDSTYDWAFYSTLDLYAMTDGTGIRNSQALEFVIEDDVSDPDNSAYTDTYTFGFNCDFMSSQTWLIWGSYVDSNNIIQGKWVPAYDASTGQTIPCQASTQFYPPNFNHYIFHFERLVEPGICYKCDSYLDFTIVYGNGTQESHQLGCGPEGCNNYGMPSQPSTSWSPGVWTHMQLDGDFNTDQYSAWADKWTVCLAPSGPTNLCS